VDEISKELEYNREEILSGVANDFNEEENESPVYDPIYLTHETPSLTEVVKADLKKPTIPEQLDK